MPMVFSLESLTFIQSYLTNRIQRVKINSSFSEYSNVESGVSQGSISGPLFFNILICDLFFDDIDIDLAIYADGTTPYACDLELDKVINFFFFFLFMFFITSHLQYKLEVSVPVGF